MIGNVWVWLSISALATLLIGVWAYRLYLKMERLRKENEKP